MTNLKVACVGAGYFAQFHFDSWSRMPRAELVGVCDRDEAKAAISGAPTYSDVGEMLQILGPDILDVIVPPVAQADVVRQALSHGTKTIICQKPFMRSLEEAREIAAEASAAGATLIVHENFRFQPWYRVIKSEVDAGRIGTLQNMSFRMRPGDGQGPEAYLDRQPYFQQMERFLVHETGVHWIDTYRYLAGEPQAVYADLRQLNPAISGEDAGYIIFDFPGNVRALLDGNRHIDHVAENHRFTMGEGHVEGTDGVLEIMGDGSVWFREKGSMTRKKIFEVVEHKGFAGDCVHALNAHVVAALLDGAQFENLANEYLKVIEIEEAVYRSAKEGCKVTL